MNPSPSPRRYESPRRTEDARRTRAAIAEAARELFVSRGWSGTTIRAVAERAHVAVPTVYAVYGSKAGLARALLEATEAIADVDAMRHELDRASGPAAQLAAMIALDRRLYERAGDVLALVREAGKEVADLALVEAEARRAADGVREDVFSGWPRTALREDISVADAVDVYASTCHLAAYTILVEERGWTADRIQSWWTTALTRLLLRGR